MNIQVISLKSARAHGIFLSAVFMASALSACHSNRSQIINDVCIPLNSRSYADMATLAKNSDADLAKLAKGKGYEVDEAKYVCRAYLKEQVQGAESSMKKLGL